KFDSISLYRSQDGLHIIFGDLGIGKSEPVLDKNLLSQVMPFHTMLIAVALGMDTEIQPVGGYAWKAMSVEQLKNLKPVDIADTAIGELILKHRQQRLDRYGVATQMIDLASVSNNAFMMRGADFYVDLMIEKEFTQHYLGVIKETMCLAYKFISETFGPIDGFPLANCNVTMMSPALYDEMICQYDIDCVEYAAKINGREPCCDLHHCDVETEPFAESYSKIPGLRSLQGSYHSDIKKILAVLPETKFSAMISPVEILNQPLPKTLDDIDKCIADGANDLAIWNIDTACGLEKLVEFFEKISKIAQEHNKEASFDVIPFSWEELAWEFPVYVNEDL
ncbi:hypothetical protein ACFL3G_11815, partial [Planctomycetota bacterium]